MSIYKRASGRYAVMIDAEDPYPYRIVEELEAKTRNGRRRANVVKAFKSKPEAERELARLDRAGDRRALQIERLARGRHSLGTFRTRKEAEKAERDALTARDRGIDLAPETLTVADLMTRYVADRVAQGRATKTTTEYERFSKLYIEPHIGQQPIAKLKPAHVSQMLATLRSGGGVDGAALSSKTVLHVRGLLNGAMRWAVDMELATRNVCDAARRNSPKAETSSAKAFNDGEIALLLATARSTRWDAFVTLALTVGARRGELLALNWSDIDLEENTVRISRALCPTTGAMKSTKTGKARLVDLSATAAAALRRQRVLQATDRLAAGEIWRGDPAQPIFTNEIGDRLTAQAATSAFAKIARRAKVSSTRLQDCRHTAGTLMVASGMDPVTVASILGHDPAVLLRIYAHAVATKKRAATDVLGDHIGRLAEAR
jgi:integrase